MDTSVLVWILAAVLVALGLAALVLPALPAGPALLFAGLVLAAWAEDFAYVGGGTIAVLGALAVLGHAVDFLAGAIGARRYGASGRAVAGAVLGGIVGLFFGLPGILLGPFLGAVLGELTVRSDLRAAGRAGFGATLGLVIGAAAKLALGLAMIGVFLFVRLA